MKVAPCRSSSCKKMCSTPRALSVVVVVADVLAVFTAITLLAIVAFPALAGEMSGTQSVPALFGGARLRAFSSGGTLAMATCEGTRWWLLPTLVLFSAAVRVVVPRMALMNSTALAIPLVATARAAPRARKSEILERGKPPSRQAKSARRAALRSSDALARKVAVGPGGATPQPAATAESSAPVSISRAPSRKKEANRARHARQRRNKREGARPPAAEDPREGRPGNALKTSLPPTETLGNTKPTKRQEAGPTIFISTAAASCIPYICESVPTQQPEGASPSQTSLSAAAASTVDAPKSARLAAFQHGRRRCRRRRRRNCRPNGAVAAPVVAAAAAAAVVREQ